MASERKRIFDRRNEGDRSRIAKEERDCTMVSWQEIWTREYRGRWTARLVPNIQKWTDRKHGELNFFLTQFFTGHGLFYAYLHKMGKVTVPTCSHCQKREDDDALHTFFKCTKWAAERSQLLAELGLTPQIPTPEAVVSKMLEGERSWSLVAAYAETILTRKTLLERERQRREHLVRPAIQN
ncbi:hypothetical protein GE061_015869 [Apolygus lucorum]|uniref:Reverse transcriptase zinc-binding domain-containing protein n=1 Tax=Apolygus lucorum TaxID=248454 RepID=A0A8S9XME6_APOLU|nr:hypothetical protein GE061_015869 [Apolygus lucorum]